MTTMTKTIKFRRTRNWLGEWRLAVWHHLFMPSSSKILPSNKIDKVLSCRKQEFQKPLQNFQQPGPQRRQPASKRMIVGAAYVLNRLFETVWLHGFSENHGNSSSHFPASSGSRIQACFETFFATEHHLKYSSKDVTSHETRIEKDTLEVSDIVIFLGETLEIARWPEGTVVVTVALVLRFLEALAASSHSTKHSRLNWRKVLLIALLVARKYIDDFPLANSEIPNLVRHMHKCAPRHAIGLGDLTLLSVNAAELDFVQSVNWSLHVHFDVYEVIRAELEQMVQVR